MSKTRRKNFSSRPARRAGFSARDIAAARANPSMSGIATISVLHASQRRTCTAFKTLTTTPPKSSVCSARTDLVISPSHFLQRLMVLSTVFLLSLLRPARDHFDLRRGILVCHDDGRYRTAINVLSLRSIGFLPISIFDVGHRASLKHVLHVEFRDTVFLALIICMILPPNKDLGISRQCS